jgi:hypothetical protein
MKAVFTIMLISIIIGAAAQNPKSVVPWKSIMANPGNYTTEEYLPAGVLMAEPSHLRMEDVKMLLNHWYNQQSNNLPALRFHHTGAEEGLHVNTVGGRKEECLRKEERSEKEETSRKGKKKQVPYKCSEGEGRRDPYQSSRKFTVKSSQGKGPRPGRSSAGFGLV